MGYAPKTHFKKTVQKLLAFTMANTNPKHPCMNHGKCKLKKTAFTMGNANSRFFVFTMVNAHFKMHLPWYYLRVKPRNAGYIRAPDRHSGRSGVLDGAVDPQSHARWGPGAFAGV